MANPAGESSASASWPNSKPQANRWSTYRSSAPVALGACCLLVSVINLWQAHQHSAVVESHDQPATGKQAHGTAVHKAVNEFLSSARKGIKPKQKQLHDTGKTPTSGQKNGGTAVTRAARNQGEDVVKGEMRAALDQDSPRYPTLECAAYGGPTPEIAQEMVYWQDIPSDTRYVSPFRGSADDDPKYMTFEPVRTFFVPHVHLSLACRPSLLC
jgi:hypothetical protein